MIKIAFLSPLGYAFVDAKRCPRHGGMELQLHILATELAKKDYESTMIVDDFGQKDGEIRDNIRFMKSVSLRMDDGIFTKIRQAFRYWQIFSRVDADIYFTCGASATVGLVAFFCFLHGKKHIHRTAHKKDINGERTKGFLGKVYEYGLRRAHILLVQNDEDRRLVKKEYGLKAEVLKNVFPIPPERFMPEKDTILWVARGEKWKNPEAFLELVKAFPREGFTMVMPKSDDIGFWESIKSQANKIPNLTFIESVPYAQTQTIFDHAKIFVSTSDSEGFPNTFLQAGVGRAPILSLNVDPDGFIEKNNCGIFCSGDNNIMKNGLESIISNVDLAKRQGQNNFDYVKNEHDLNGIICQLSQLISTIK